MVEFQDTVKSYIFAGIKFMLWLQKTISRRRQFVGWVILFVDQVNHEIHDESPTNNNHLIVIKITHQERGIRFSVVLPSVILPLFYGAQ